jgi:hypothetical protein
MRFVIDVYDIIIAKRASILDVSIAFHIGVREIGHSDICVFLR